LFRVFREYLAAKNVKKTALNELKSFALGRWAQSEGGSLQRHEVQAVMPEAGEVLAWDGLAQCVDNLKASLETWSCEERVRALERQTDAAQAQQDAAAVTSALRKASFEDPWEQSLSTLLQDAKAKREEFLKVLEMLRKHTKFLKEDSDLAKKIPKDAQLATDDLPSFVVKFLEHMVEVKPKGKEKKEKSDAKEKNEKKSKSTEAEDDDEEKGKDKKKSGKEKTKEKTKDKGKDAKDGKDAKEKAKEAKEDRKKRRKKSGKERDGSEGSEDYSDYSYSKTPSPRPKRRRKRRRRRRRPSPSSSRSDSYTPSRESRRRRGRRKRRRREDKDSKLNVGAEIDRFVRVNKLEDRCEKILRDLDAPLAFKVMGLSGGTNTFELSGDVRDPTAVVLARIRKAQFARDVQPAGGRRGRRRRSSSRSR